MTPLWPGLAFNLFPDCLGSPPYSGGFLSHLLNVLLTLRSLSGCFWRTQTTTASSMEDPVCAKAQGQETMSHVQGSFQQSAMQRETQRGSCRGQRHRQGTKLLRPPASCQMLWSHGQKWLQRAGRRSFPHLRVCPCGWQGPILHLCCNYSTGL
jgi:hypothetical protein